MTQKGLAFQKQKKKSPIGNFVLKTSQLEICPRANSIIKSLKKRCKSMSSLAYHFDVCSFECRVSIGNEECHVVNGR